MLPPTSGSPVFKSPSEKSTSNSVKSAHMSETGFDSFAPISARSLCSAPPAAPGCLGPCARPGRATNSANTNPIETEPDFVTMFLLVAWLDSTFCDRMVPVRGHPPCGPLLLLAGAFGGRLGLLHPLRHFRLHGVEIEARAKELQTFLDYPRFELHTSLHPTLRGLKSDRRRASPGHATGRKGCAVRSLIRSMWGSGRAALLARHAAPSPQDARGVTGLRAPLSRRPTLRLRRSGLPCARTRRRSSRRRSDPAARRARPREPRRSGGSDP